MPFAPELLRQQFPPPYTQNIFQRAAEALGFKCGWRAIPTIDLALPAVPWIALLNQTNAESAPAPQANNEPTAEDPPTHTLALILKCTEAQITYLREGDQAPVTEPRSQFETKYAGNALQATRAAPALQDPDAAPDAQGTFGFKWFIPELLKHKSIWRDVLGASLVIQLMALATPIFTQVVIDKVIVHQTLSTLTVIAFALAVFILFSAGLTWVRQYLVLHTGNRIDAVLGSKVFEHLFKLPPRYFEHRGTGVLVARVHGVETTFGVVPQETILFSGTIYENLTLANAHASFKEVIHACKLAEIHDTIEQLPQGYWRPQA